MDDTKKLSESSGAQLPAESSGTSSDETKSLSESEGLRSLLQGACGSSDGDPTVIGRYRVVHRLGEGGFGRVYLAHDDDLGRPVAIKVPNPEHIRLPRDAEAFLVEARILAKLDHPNIVPVFDVGRTEDGHYFVVSKLIEGDDLAARSRRGRPSFREAAELVAVIADALHYAHTRGLVHRDVKPANILIDATGKAFVADFGLALKDEDFGKGGGLAGTPDYMSPEQARGEGHRVDGRSDVFSLGVVFYELLTGRRPFRGDSLPEVIESIKSTEPRPPRQTDDTIPRELERICQQALSKRASERYSTGRDMAEDLRAFLQTGVGTTPPLAVPALISPPPVSTQEASAQPITPRGADSNQPVVKVVPKGLRSYDQHDADYFLGLLPGARDRDGLPESIRFWKRKIEQLDSDLTFKVGLIYGPSGCGKSSMLKAGLLPRLSKSVLPVYVEATAEGTEARLLKSLRKACPQLSRELGLVDSLAQLRRHGIPRPDRKVLLVLDQFEQWLLARRGEENTELVTALRHCDGEHVQAIVLVRDDFWLAASRFMRDLEIRLVEGENSLLMDLFDPRHARKVLMAFGQAYGALPENAGEFSRDQDAFLDRSISALAQDGKIISVRLSLFAEMMKGKPWTSATLKEMGGIEGVGLTFLEETFSASNAPPEHRFHQKAARAVLNALLPKSRTDLKGEMRSRQELLAASGYASRPGDFDDLIRILDSELRLITPTDPDGSSVERQDSTSGGQFYQLAHDYLVHTLWDWLTRKQRETRRGRAELLLETRGREWAARPTDKLLPSAVEWLLIWALTRRTDWSVAQKKMMRKASFHHTWSTVVMLPSYFFFIVTIFGLFWILLNPYVAKKRDYVNDRFLAEHDAGSLIRLMRNVPIGKHQTIAMQLKFIDTRLREAWKGINGAHIVKEAYEDYIRFALNGTIKAYEDIGVGNSENSLDRDHWRHIVHARLFLFLDRDDRSQVEHLEKLLMDAPATELGELQQALYKHREAFIPKLWAGLEAAGQADAKIFALASSLAAFDPDNARWSESCEKVATAAAGGVSSGRGQWATVLKPVRSSIAGPLKRIADDSGQAWLSRIAAKGILSEWDSYGMRSGGR